MFDDDSNDPQERAFRILGLHQGAATKEVTGAYHALANKYHPDRVSHLADEFQDLARQKMAEINQAYQSIKRQRVHDEESSGSRSKKRPTPKKPTLEKPTTQTNQGRGGSGDLRFDVCFDRDERELVPTPESPKKEREVKVTFSCPCCKSRITVPLSHRGKEGQCTRCRQLITVPTHIELRCTHCGKRNRLPLELDRKRAVCRACYGSLIKARALRLTNQPKK